MSRDAIRDSLRRQGFFVTGVTQYGLSAGAWQVEADVNTFERTYDRANVPTHASDDNVNGVNNLFLTSQFGDMPAPAGTHPWVIGE